jgi:acyl carrier protein
VGARGGVKGVHPARAIHSELDSGIGTGQRAYQLPDGNRACSPGRHGAPADRALLETRRMSSSTFDTVADIISETADIPRDTVTPESHAIDDLGIDSLAFLDIAFAVDKAFGIKLPLEQWTQEVNEGKVPAEEYFVLKNLVARIDDLVAAKKA